VQLSAISMVDVAPSKAVCELSEFDRVAETRLSRMHLIMLIMRDLAHMWSFRLHDVDGSACNRDGDRPSSHCSSLFGFAAPNEEAQKRMPG
jgi:hypothetical protein